MGIGSTQQCQKCFRTGHWTYECKNQKAYLYRPSRTAVLKQPEIAPKYIFDSGGFDNPKSKGGKGQAVHDGDWKRSTLRKVSSSSSSVSSDNEQKDLHQQLQSLIKKVKQKRDKKKEKTKKKKKRKQSSSSSSRSSSSSESSKSSKSSRRLRGNRRLQS